ncbi:MAG: glucoamylase family protein [Phocaeicola sp.]
MYFLILTPFPPFYFQGFFCLFSYLSLLKIQLDDLLLMNTETKIRFSRKYGFYDAFSEEVNWTVPRYLAIDQCPIAPMIENHRTGLLWDLFMSCEEIQQGLTKLGFTY